MKKSLLILLVLISACSVMAQGSGGPCHEDAQKYCGQISGGKQIAECLLDHQKDISDACYDTLKKRMNNQQSLQACKQDVEQLCKGIQPGGGRLKNCLLDHQNEISDNCSDALAKDGNAKK